MCALCSAAAESQTSDWLTQAKRLILVLDLVPLIEFIMNFIIIIESYIYSIMMLTSATQSSSIYIHTETQTDSVLTLDIKAHLNLLSAHTAL